MPTYVVVLEIRFHGSSAGTTRDEIEADSEQKATEKAIRQWRKIRPDRTFAALYAEAVTD